MTTDGDCAARALAEAWQHFTDAMAEAWMVREDGALAGVTGVPLPTLNRVWVDETGAEVKTVAMLLNRVATTGLPHCLQLRPGCDPALGELAARRGMTPSADVPLMVLEDAEGIGVAEPTDLLIRRLAPQDASHHASVAAAGFEAPEEYLQQLLTTGVHIAPGVCYYLGELHGEPVTTGLGVTLGDSVGIFNIVTLQAHRRQGYEAGEQSPLGSAGPSGLSLPRTPGWRFARLSQIRSRDLPLCSRAYAAGVLVAACFVAPERSAKLTGVPPAALDEERVRWTAMAR